MGYWEGIRRVVRPWNRIPREAGIPGIVQGEVGHWGLELPGMVEMSLPVEQDKLNSLKFYSNPNCPGMV